MTAKSFWVFLFPVFIGFQGLLAQQINIEKIDNTQITENISSIENIMFPDNNLKINFYSAPSETINLLSIRKIYFEMATGIDDLVSNDGKPALGIYPNPVNNFFVIRNLPDQNTDAKVCSLVGNVVQQTVVSASSPQVKVDGLEPGIYLVKIKGETLKLVKQ